MEHRIAPDTGRNVQCICGDEFSLVSSLNRHIATANGTAPRLGTRVHVPQIGQFGTVAELTPGHDALRVRVALDGGGWIDTDERKLTFQTT